MMKKIFPGLLTLISIYVLPLLGSFSHLYHPALLLAAMGCLAILLSQPPLSRDRVKADQQADKYSVLVILILAWVGQVLTVVEWRLAGHAAFAWDWMAISGLTLMVLGIAIRIWAIQTLGAFFTPTVRVQHDQQIITHGPYAWVRHPSYLGAYIALAGFPILLHTPWSVGFVTCAMIIAYVLRIREEEKTLILHFGRIYKEYQLRTRRMFPGIW